jgi:glycosyltransferase involved in cell wall biosynthesis
MKISVIIPNYNMELYIERTLESLNNQTLPKDDYEVIIIENNSTDNSKEVIEKSISNIPTFKLFSEQKQGPSFCRNTGIHKAQYDIIYFTDADCIVEKDVLAKIKNIFDNSSEYNIVGGKVLHYLTDPVNISYHYFRFGFILDNECVDKVDYLTTSNIAFRKCIFFKENIFFDTELHVDGAEDTLLCLTFRNKGYDILYDRDLVVYHIPEFTLKKVVTKTYKIAKNYSLILFKGLNLVSNKRWLDMLKVWIYPIVFYFSIIGYLLYSFFHFRILLIPLIPLITYYGFLFYRSIRRYENMIKGYSSSKLQIVSLLFLYNIIERILFVIFLPLNFVKKTFLAK